MLRHLVVQVILNSVESQNSDGAVPIRVSLNDTMYQDVGIIMLNGTSILQANFDCTACLIHYS